MKVKVKAPGSCGELVQGVIDDKPFLITCPVTMYSEVEIYAGSMGQSGKVQTAIRKTLEYLAVSDTYYQAVVKSELPVGKGMASSSADISAACQAVALQAGKKLSADEIADIALSIEPTDGIFYPGIMLFDHISGTIRRSLGNPPRIKILIFDIGGKVNTVAFNKRRDLVDLNQRKEAEVRRAVTLVKQGIEQGDARLIGQGATLSALANQAILYKPCLEKALEIAMNQGAVGVNIAHSGTVIGVMFTPDKEEIFSSCIENIYRACPKLKFIRCVDLVGGGLWIQEGENNEWKISI